MVQTRDQFSAPRLGMAIAAGESDRGKTAGLPARLPWEE
jgi:hypothetical protein